LGGLHDAGRIKGEPRRNYQESVGGLLISRRKGEKQKKGTSVGGLYLNLLGNLRETEDLGKGDSHPKTKRKQIDLQRARVWRLCRLKTKTISKRGKI